MTWLWAALSWTDVLDIGIMAYLLYRVLLLIRGTRALQSLLGLVALLLLYVLAERLELNGISWLLDKFFVYIVLVVLVLFQQDIRRALASAGGRLFPAFRSRSELSMLEELVKASYALASRRIGALIAIERSASLEEFTEPATSLDALVSQDLLFCVFHPTSPLHDGAIVIRKERIAAAQVFLPLSQSKDVSRLLGTRHRAAIGLTEETDAVVVIVSEERGSVSIVRDGQITPTSDTNELREQLQKIFGTPVAKPPTTKSPPGPAPEERRRGA